MVARPWSLAAGLHHQLRFFAGDVCSGRKVHATGDLTIASTSGQTLHRSTSRARAPESFAATRWSIVLAAGRGGAHATARRALSDLCQTYWYPLYAYVRRRGLSPQDAEDLVQAFFARLLEKGDLAQEIGRAHV